MDVNMEVLEPILPDIRKTLKDALLSADILDMESGLSLFSYESNPVASALFPRLTIDLKETLITAGLPQLRNWFMLNLEGGVISTVTHEGNIMCGFAVDTNRANLGILVNLALPRVLSGLREAQQRS